MRPFPMPEGARDMDTTTTADVAAPALSGTQAWLVGISLAAVALGSLATALALQGPAHDAEAAEPRGTIVSIKSPAPRAALDVVPAAPAAVRIEGDRAWARVAPQPTRTAPPSAPGRTSPDTETKPRSLAEAKRL
jgi:hypothetical protein